MAFYLSNEEFKDVLEGFEFDYKFQMYCWQSFWACDS